MDFKKWIGIIPCPSCDDTLRFAGGHTGHINMMNFTCSCGFLSTIVTAGKESLRIKASFKEEENED